MDVKGSVAVVTGAGSGLGAGTARRLAAAGSTVVLLDLAVSAGKKIAEDLGERAHFYECDVADPTAVEGCIGWVLERHGRLDVCVSAAGIPDSARMVTQGREPFPLETYRRVLDINLIGLFDVMRHAARAMTFNSPGEDGERGVIINVASVAAYEGHIGQVAYAASKGGVVSMTLPAARDLASWGIRVVTVCPGLFDTGMFAGLDDRIRDRYARVPVFPQRAGDPAEFGHLVETIVTNRMLNGETIRLDAAARL